MIDRINEITHKIIHKFSRKICSTLVFRLKHRDFDGSKVLIVGPSTGVSTDLQAADPSAYDYIVGFNRSLMQEPFPGWERLDIIFHNFNFDGERSAGNLSRDRIAQRQVRFIVYPHGRRKNLSRSFMKYWARHQFRGGRYTVGTLPAALSERASTILGGRLPTTGFSALAFFLACPLRELTVVGMTFFRTGYTQKYNELAQSAEAAFRWTASAGHHAPELEAEQARRLILDGRKKGLVIRLGSETAKVLDLSPR